MIYKIILTHVLFWIWLFVVGESQAKNITLDVFVKYDTLNLNKHINSSRNSDDDKSNSIYRSNLGFRLGGNFSNTNFNQGYPKPTMRIETMWKTGYSGGLIVEIPLYRKLCLQQEYAFAFQNGGVRDAEITYNLCYVSLPVLLKFNLLPKLAIMAGPQFDLLVQAREDYNGKITNITHDVEERNISAVAGFAYVITKRISVDARYVQGLNHIGISQGAINQEFKLQALQLSIDYTPFR